MSTSYKRPILSTIFDFLGAIVLIGGGICIVGGFVSTGERYLIGSGIAGIVVAIFYFGVAQVIDFLGRTAFATNRLATIIEINIVEHIKRIESRLDSSTPIRVRVDQPKQDKPRFHYMANETQEGPFTAAEMHEFRESGVVTPRTQVFRDGDSNWRTFKDFPELSIL